jgi:hypothetical protein
MYPSQAAALARNADLAVIAAIRPESEAFDAPDLLCLGARMR